ncbi:Uncharacterized protein TCM_042798 [Theobroma cacao]|uniref:Uncharacterized protein n=1 Tax=Theobroma cacao TaxID=3641 RepID=A0A061FMU4_THECC|nr:Uncharacterized protein TCM_042798 [Theobroma cacao]
MLQANGDAHFFYVGHLAFLIVLVATKGLFSGLFCKCTGDLPKQGHYVMGVFEYLGERRIMAP